MWRLIGKESVAMSTCYRTCVGYNLYKSYIDIYVYIGLYICDSWLKFTRLRAGEAVCRSGSNLCEITVSIMRL